MLTRHPHLQRRASEVQRLLLLVTGSWLLPVLVLAACVAVFG